MKQIKKSSFLFLALLLVAGTSFGQTNSLEKKLQSATSDTQRVNIMNVVAITYLPAILERAPAPGAFDSGMSYATKAYAMAAAINYKRGMGEALYAQGKSLSQNESHKKSLDLLFKALPFLREYSFPPVVAACLKFIANDFHAVAELTPAILYYDSARSEFLLVKDSANALYCLTMKGHCYYDLGNYKDAYTFGGAADQMATKTGRADLETFTKSHLARLFLGANLPHSAIDYARRVIQLNTPLQYPLDLHSPVRWPLNSAGQAFLLLHETDSAAIVAGMMVVDSTDVDEMLFRGKLAAAQLKYPAALLFFEQGYHFSIVHNHPLSLCWHANELARVYLATHQYKKAIAYASETLHTAQQIHALTTVASANFTLSDIYGETKDYGKAYYFNKQAKLLNDSLVPDEYRRALSLIQVQHDLTGQQQQIRLLSRENQLKESNLLRERTIRNASIATILALLIIGLLILFNIRLRKNSDQVQQLMKETNTRLENREKEKKMAELEKEKIDLEMQALRAQMNPHFIFNCLSSINRFILKNETEAASDYLTKFSRLIRMVLVNSKNSFIALEDELDMLRLYLDMERLRFLDAFDYSISLTNSIDVRSLFMPPLLLQPFAENAIWHGLMHKEGPGRLTIELSLKEEILYCIITDNGIGREEAGRIRTKFMEKQKSMGLQITADRLALLNKGIDEPIFFNIIDLHDEQGHANGTRVTIKILCKDRIESLIS